MSEINSSPYKGSTQITREQFLFYEMRTTARQKQNALETLERTGDFFGRNIAAGGGCFCRKL